MMPDIAHENAQAWADIQHISGGQLNTGKCYYYAFQNKINYKTNEVICSDIKVKTPISINNNDAKTTNIPQIKSSGGHCTLGAIRSPNGSNKGQLRFSLQRAKEFRGKLKNTGLSPMAQWLTIMMVLEPAITYPLVTCLFTSNSIQQIDSIMSQLKCSVLGLNRNFPRAVLHEPPELGGMGVPSSKQKITSERINYFLYNI
jgi:hypothetical protein